ncbi:MAG TPA: hypothetical protein VIH01_01315, partial [Blastococcus sp.]
MVMSPARPVRGPAHIRSGLFRSFWPRPRIRRPADIARLVASAAALAGLVLLSFFDPALLSAAGRAVPTALTGLPRAALSVLNVLASLAVIGVLLAVVVDALRSRRFALTSAALACAVGLLIGVAIAAVAGVARDPEVARMLIGPPRESAGLPVTATVALVVGADLRGRRWLGPAELALTVAIVCALPLGSLTVPSAAYAVLVGTTAGLAVRVALGVVPARPTDDVVRAVLAGAGWRLTALRPL